MQDGPLPILYLPITAIPPVWRANDKLPGAMPFGQGLRFSYCQMLYHNGTFFHANMAHEFRRGLIAEAGTQPGLSVMRTCQTGLGIVKQRPAIAPASGAAVELLTIEICKIVSKLTKQPGLRERGCVSSYQDEL
jgi:hypothetical protein